MSNVLPPFFRFTVYTMRLIIGHTVDGLHNLNGFVNSKNNSEATNTVQSICLVIPKDCVENIVV